MGLSALKSHARGKGHINTAGQLNKERQMTDSMRGPASKDAGEGSSCTTKKEPQAATESVSHGNTASQDSSTETEGSSAFFSSQAVFEAEIRWVIKMVKSHYSFNSSSDISVIFRQMFPDSAIAKQFSCGATKSAYLVCFGSGPYFKQQLIRYKKSTVQRDLF